MNYVFGFNSNLESGCWMNQCMYPIVFDTIREQYSLNPKFHAYDSDMLGCYYNNNWNSIVYGVGEHPVISVTVFNDFEVDD